MARDFIYDFRLQHPCRSSRASPYSSSNTAVGFARRIARDCREANNLTAALDNPRRGLEIIAEELHIACASDHPGPDTHGR